MSTSKKIKAGRGLRILFAIFVLLLGASLFVVGVKEKKKRDQWQGYQETYKQLYTERLDEKLSRTAKDAAPQEVERLARMRNDAKALQAKMNVVFLPDAEVRDLCTTCHAAMENPMFRQDPHPLKTHPKEILTHHNISNYGCTFCHHGQGVGLSVEKAHGFEENWESPRLPLIYTQSTCLECHETVYNLKGAEKAASGKSLFIEKGCYGCHDARVRSDLPKYSTPFNGISQKVAGKAWLAKWIENPVELRPATLMPKFRLSQTQLHDLVAYLYGLENNALTLTLADDGQGSAKRGETTFTEKACVACHSEKADAAGLTRRIPQLLDAGLKLKGDWLINWISDPLSINPDTWMPKLDLTQADIKDLTAYLKTLSDQKTLQKLEISVPSGDADKGKILAQSLGCLGCHPVRGNPEPAKVGVSVTDVADKRMAELPFGNAKIAYTKWDWIKNKIADPAIYKTEDMPMAMPDFDLNTEEVAHLTIFYLFNRMRPLPEKYLVRTIAEEDIGEKGQWLLSHYNCRGCHKILPDETPRIDQSIAKKSMLPPTIVDEAEKVQPAWLYNYLERPFAMRPWLLIRMPAFNINFEDKSMLISYLHTLMPEEKQEKTTMPYYAQLVKSDYDQETLDMGKYRFRSDKCMQCHPVSFTGELPEGKKLEDLSINLMLAKSRLRFEWVKNFLRNPDQYAGAGTKMPFVYYTPDKAPRIPDPESWINRTALFMMFMEKVPAPMKTEEKTREVKTFDFSNY